MTVWTVSTGEIHGMSIIVGVYAEEDDAVDAAMGQGSSYSGQEWECIREGRWICGDEFVEVEQWEVS